MITQLSEAIILATRAHEGQLDKGGMPYILHPLRVMQRVNRKDEMVVAVLHDIVEDTPVTLDQLRLSFDYELVEAIGAITRKDNEVYKEYIKRVYTNSIARMVKIADLKDNLDVNRPGGLEFLTISGMASRYMNALRFLITGDLNQYES